MVRQIKNIFMSYSRDDKHWTYEFAKALREDLNFSVFVDYRSIYIGTNWWRTICENIESADCIIYVMTPKSIESIYCTAEINYALALNKPILPIMLKSCTFPPSLSNKQVQYLTLRDDMQIEKILIEIQKGLFEVQRFIFSGAYNPPNPTPPQPDEPKAQDTKSAEEVFEYGATLAYEGQLDQAELLYQQAYEANRDVILKKEIERAQAELGAYKRIVRYANNPATLRNARNLWVDYLSTYGDEFDPLELGQKLALSPSKIETPPQTPVRTTFSSSTPKIESPPIPSFLPQPFDWCKITGGKVTIGYGNWENGQYIVNHTKDFNVPDFFMAKYPLTNAQYQAFVDAHDGYKNPEWWAYSEGAKAWRKANPKPENTRFRGDDHPRTNITWYESVAFTLWLSNKVGVNIHLPTEEQWQRAAIGDKNWAYPYGNEFDKNRCNFDTSGTTPVTQYPNGASPFGVMDMSGNVWEWCLTSYDKGNIPLKDAVDDRTYVLRGGSWGLGYTNSLRADVRNWGYPDYGNRNGGMRFACSY